MLKGILRSAPCEVSCVDPAGLKCARLGFFSPPSLKLLRLVGRFGCLRIARVANSGSAGDGTVYFL